MYKLAATSGTISFDFDDTICKHPWDAANNDFQRDEKGKMIGILNPVAQSLISQYKAAGNRVILVTSRHDTPQNREDVSSFLADNGITVDGMYFTDNKLKAELLKSMDVKKHYDDDIDEVYACIVKGISCESI